MLLSVTSFSTENRYICNMIQVKRVKSKEKGGEYTVWLKSSNYLKIQNHRKTDRAPQILRVILVDYFSNKNKSRDFRQLPRFDVDTQKRDISIRTNYSCRGIGIQMVLWIKGYLFPYQPLAWVRNFCCSWLIFLRSVEWKTDPESGSPPKCDR